MFGSVIHDVGCVFDFVFFLKRGSDFSELGGWTQTPEKGILLESEASGVVRSGCLEVAEAPAPQFNESPVAFLGIWEAKRVISRLRFAGTYICKYWVLTPTWIPDHLPFGVYVTMYLHSSYLSFRTYTLWAVLKWRTSCQLDESTAGSPEFLWNEASLYEFGFPVSFSWLQLPDRVK